MKRIILRNFSEIKDTIVKCSDCKNFIPHIENNTSHDGLGKCRVNGYNLKSGPVYFYASLCRKDNIYCGEKGKFFVKK
jgi:hypothetical protein